MTITKTLSTEVSINDACHSLNVARATFYRHQQQPPPRSKKARRSPRALTAVECADNRAGQQPQESLNHHFRLQLSLPGL